MNRFLIHIMALLACCAALAQESTNAPSASRLDEYMTAGMEVGGIRFPYYDDSGELKAQLYGGKARILGGGAAEVTNLRIDVFEDRKVFMSLYAPKCRTEIKETDGKRKLVVHSDGKVLIDLEQMTISGRGFRFSSEENRFEILHDSKVLVKEAARNMPGVEF